MSVVCARTANAVGPVSRLKPHRCVDGVQSTLVAAHGAKSRHARSKSTEHVKPLNMQMRDDLPPLPMFCLEPYTVGERYP